MDKLQQHTLAKKTAVNGWDLISTFFGIAGGALIAASCVQPKTPINQLRIPAALVMMVASVASEKLRENDLMSLDKAIEYHGTVQSERIRRDVFHSQVLEDLKEEDEIFAKVPRDQWPALAARLGVNPPNYEAREPQQPQRVIPEPQVQSASPFSAPSVVVANRAVDPCADGYDPEAPQDRAATTNEVLGDCLVLADQVMEWFAKWGDALPDMLFENWRSNPGLGIQVKDGMATILRGDGDVSE